MELFKEKRVWDSKVKPGQCYFNWPQLIYEECVSIGILYNVFLYKVTVYYGVYFDANQGLDVG